MRIDDATVQRQVHREHRRVDALFAELVDAVREGEERDAVKASFERLRETVEQHLAQEDRVYGPALPGLAAGPRGALEGLLAEHDGFRAALAGLGGAIGDAPFGALADRLAALAGAFARHESEEEALLEVLVGAAPIRPA